MVTDLRNFIQSEWPVHTLNQLAVFAIRSKNTTPPPRRISNYTVLSELHLFDSECRVTSSNKGFFRSAWVLGSPSLNDAFALTGKCLSKPRYLSFGKSYFLSSLPMLNTRHQKFFVFIAGCIKRKLFWKLICWVIPPRKKDRQKFIVPSHGRFPILVVRFAWAFHPIGCGLDHADIVGITRQRAHQRGKNSLSVIKRSFGQVQHARR